MLNNARYHRHVATLLPLFYLVGFIFHRIEATYPLMLALTPYTILGTAIIGFLPDVMARDRKLLLWAAATFLCTFALEVAGVATGAIFGAYTYGPTLGFSIGGVPLLIGINWTLIIMGTATFMGRYTTRASLAAVGTAAVTVVFDWIMEPVAISLDYWWWDGKAIPVQNYVAWFVISFIFARVFSLLKLKSVSTVPSLIVAVQAIFFLLLRLFVI